MTQFAGRFTRSGATDILTVGSPQALPGPLTISQGVYTIGSDSYDCRNFQGLLRVMLASGQAVNRIVYKDDLYALLSGFAWLHVHGYSDEPVAGENWDTSWITRMGTLAKSQSLRLRCGHISRFVSWFLQYLGFQVRTVRWLTMVDPAGQPWQGIDEGHISIEVFYNGAWRNFDPDLHIFFTDCAGNHLNAKGVPAAVASGDFKMESLSRNAAYTIEPAQSGVYNLTPWSELAFVRDSEPIGESWIKRTCQAVGIDRPNGESWFLLPPGSDSRKAWVESLSPLFKVKTETEFDAAFYA